MYSNTTAAVWNGEYLSEYFPTYVGVKQGCLLSPLLFALLLNDLHDALGGGLLLDGVLVRVLMYADDIIILAEDPKILKEMIQKLENYYKIWNFNINLEKSKIMIFTKGGRRAKEEKWYNGTEIEIVNKYIPGRNYDSESL